MEAGFWERCLEVLEYSWNRVNSNTPVMILVIFAFTFLWKKRNREINTYLVYPGALLILLMLNPLMEYIFIDKLGLDDRIHRFYWIIPITFILAFASLELIYKVKARKGFLFFFILAVWVIIGRNVYDEDHYVTENIYKMEDEVIELSQTMHEIESEDSFRVYINEIHPNYTIRQYDPSFLLIQRPRDLDATMSSPDLESLSTAADAAPYLVLAGYFYGHYSIDLSVVQDAVNYYGIQYLILDYEDLALEMQDWIEPKAETDDYFIYKVISEQ